MSVIVTIPAGLVRYVREEACSELQDATDALTSELARSSTRPENPGRFIEHRGYYNAVCALLDQLGWIGQDPPVDVEVNLREHRTILLTAARDARETAEHDFSEVQDGKVKDPPKRQAITERVIALRGFALAVEVKARDMQHERRRRPLRSTRDLGEAITAAFQEVEVARQDVAALCDLDPSVIAQLEQDQGDLPFSGVLLLLHTLGLDVELSHRRLSPAQIAARDTPPLVIPSGMERPLRSILISVLATGAQDIAQNAMYPEREQHPDWFSEGRENLEDTWRLLDTLGWADPPQPAETTINLYQHRWALNEALDKLLNLAEDDLKEIDTVDAERAEQGEPPVREQTIERVRLMREFAAQVKARIDAFTDG